MGFFSWNCKACGHSVISSYAVESNNEWMTMAVVLTEDGDMIRGEYDGYGRVGHYDYNEDGSDPEMYHEACWEVIGKPTEFSGPSESARDQGYFFDNDVHNVHPPRDMQELHNLKVAGDLAEQACRNAWAIANLEWLLDKAHKAMEIGEERERTLEDIKRHIENRQKKEDRQEAKRIGLSYEDYLELKEKMCSLMDEDDIHRERPTHNMRKVEKLEDGKFRLENNNDLIVDYDYENDKAYMVKDPWAEIAVGTERDNWLN
jgi:hypothetical protein